NYPGPNPLTNAESYATFAATVGTGATYRIIHLQGGDTITPSQTNPGGSGSPSTAGTPNVQRRELLSANGLAAIGKPGGHLPVHRVTQTPRNSLGAPFIQRTPIFGADELLRDIDPLDSATYPKQDRDVFGISFFMINGQELVSYFNKNGIDGLKNELFPLPQYSMDWRGNCIITNRDLTVNVHPRMRVLTRPPWSRTVPRSSLVDVLNANLAVNRNCLQNGTTVATMHGRPNDHQFYTSLMTAEQQHAFDYRCLFNRYVMGHQQAVRRLPRQLSGPTNNCDLNLDLELNRTSRAQAFLQEYRLFNDFYDAGARHHTARYINHNADANCTHTEATYGYGALPNATRDCSPWTPSP
ncbi:MAG: hypothetical protein AAF466_02180, partial [Bacteroidota bacterium]